MRLICSPALQPADFDAMKAAIEPAARAQVLVREELEVLLTRPDTLPATRLLATLIAADILEVQVAFLDHAPGIFHDKLGVFQDNDGRRVSFVGSANETWAAWGLNHESFEVFCSWRGETELLRTRRHANDFERLWHGADPGVHVEPLAQVTRDRLIAVADPDLDRAMDRARHQQRSQPEERVLMPHQLAALEDWRQRGRRGIVAFATGAGKTLVGLAAVKEWTDAGLPALVLVPGRELHRQWMDEIAIDMPEAVPLACGAGAPVSAWGHLLPLYSSADFSRDSRRIVLATNATFASADFQARLQDGDHLLVVADEMHRLGSQTRIKALGETSIGAAMGLSATYRRQFDETGTADLVEWFGEPLDPVIGLAEAILMGRLVPYDYRLHTLQLDDDELERYELITTKIGRAIAREGSGPIPTDYLRMLLIERARLLKQARGKVGAALDVLNAEFEEGQRWLVYCDDTAQLASVVAGTLAVGLPVMEFHSAMQGDRTAVLRSLAAHGGVVVAIRCLDEGVDLPACDHALILASSTVDREYIQRRGRVLRSAPGKVMATVHDLLLVNQAGGVLTRSEAMRALEFARLSRNPAARAHLQLLLALSPDLAHVPTLSEAEDDDEEADA